jgi:hypothetical protein
MAKDCPREANTGTLASQKSGGCMTKRLDVKREDEIFMDSHPEMFDPSHRAQITKEVLEIAKEQGIPPSKVMEAFQRGDPAMRSAVAQGEWYRAAKSRIDARKDDGGDLSVRKAARILARRRGTHD